MIGRLFLLAALVVASSASVSIILPHEALAQAASHCLRFGTVSQYGSRSQSITNTCGQKVHLIWCHDKSGASFESGRCGRNGDYYQKEWIFQPGEKYSNQYSLPISAYINYGACFGSVGSAQPSGNGGRYNCQ